MLSFPSLIIASINIPTVINVVMMGAEDMYQWRRLFYGSHWVNFTAPYPHPFTVSSPIENVYKEEHQIKPTKSNFYWSYEGKNAAVFAYQGRMPDFMEDRFVIDENINGTGISLYGVFDGYKGNLSVNYLAYNLMDSLKTKILNIKENPSDQNSKQYVNPDGGIDYKKLLHDEIISADKKLLRLLRKHALERSGSTALIAITENNQLFVANVGNSRAIMCDAQGTATRLTVDHHPNVTEERKRIEESGGQVTLEGGVLMVDGLLPISRCLGDRYIKESKHVVPTPDVFVYDLAACKSKFVMLTTDGVWSNVQMDEQLAVTIVNDNLEDDLLDAMKELTERAGSAFFYDDNQTIMVIKTPQPA